ncbi:Gfo/Idh/MocA family oxidoreductase [Pedococcus sp. KACC 23699]|uniref:Gfo/Idh/MocA family oxidoreductase n=1 Tax=Pedococcus sp. KACC 23699 TaxID=3149228 RepID=A0AAU7JVD8_9MICO
MAFAARDAAKTESVATRLGIPRTYTDTGALIADGEVDAVYIATPHPLHRDLALEAIAAGKHVLVEKPMAMSAAETQEITDAARAASVLAMEAMWTRYLPQSDTLRQILAEGLIGRPHLVHADFGLQMPYDPDHRLWNAELGGGAMLDACIYTVNLASLVLGAPATIDATGNVLPSGVDVTANILITKASWAFAVVVGVLRMTSGSLHGWACSQGPGHAGGTRLARLVGRQREVPSRVCAVTSSPFGWEVSGCDAGTEVGWTGLRTGAMPVVRAGACGSQARAGPCRHQRSGRSH